MFDDTLMSVLLLNIPVDTLLEIYEGTDRKYRLLANKVSIRHILLVPCVVEELCKRYDVDVTSSFMDFLATYDRRWNFKDVSLKYFSKRWKLTYYSAHTAIQHIGHTLELVDTIMSSGLLTHSQPHVIEACKTAHGDKYLHLLTTRLPSQNIEIFSSLCMNGVCNETTIKLVGSSPMLVYIGACMWDRVPREKLPYNVYSCAVLCNNIELYRHTEKLVPTHMLNYLDTRKNPDLILEVLNTRRYHDLSVEMIIELYKLTLESSQEGKEHFYKMLSGMASDIANVDKFRKLQDVGIMPIKKRPCVFIVLYEKGNKTLNWREYSCSDITYGQRFDVWLHKNGFDTSTEIGESVIATIRYNHLDHEVFVYWLTYICLEMESWLHGNICRVLANTPLYGWYLEWYNTKYP